MASDWPGCRLALLNLKRKRRPPTVAPFTDSEVKRIAALPAAEQVEEVRKELKKRNPEFGGTLTPTIENDVVTGIEFFTNHVLGIFPCGPFHISRRSIAALMVRWPAWFPI